MSWPTVALILGLVGILMFGVVANQYIEVLRERATRTLVDIIGGRPEEKTHDDAT